MLLLREHVNKGDINIIDATKLCCRNKKKIYSQKLYGARIQDISGWGLKEGTG